MLPKMMILIYITWSDLFSGLDVIAAFLYPPERENARTFERATYVVLSTQSYHVTRSIEVVNLQKF